jgi:response regulator RpfG family c-di-GMP phosphodiesterase
MSTAEGSGGSSSPESVALGQALLFFGSVADYAAATVPDQGERVASLAAAMANLAEMPKERVDALYFAARLRNAGALGNPAFAKGEQLPDRALRMHLWDIPAEGARVCEQVAALPGETADILRWQAESWDGTGFPDQLRWSGIPKAAQLLHIASAFTAIADPDEALQALTSESGRAFAPELVRTFVMWFHTFGGEIEVLPPPYEALDASRTPLMDVVSILSQSIDRHNGTPQRAERIERRVRDLSAALSLSKEDEEVARLSALLFGSGEIRAEQLESAQFDPLARLGAETRAIHAAAAAGLAEQSDLFACMAPVLRARAEWYDGTGGPDRLRHDTIPRASQILAAAIAFDALSEAFQSRITEERTLPITRIETAAGTQFDPEVIRALSDVVKTHA